MTGEARAEAIAAWQSLYDGGASIRDIAKETGCPYSTIRQGLVAAGVTLRGRGGGRVYNGLSEEQRAALKSRLDALYEPRST